DTSPHRSPVIDNNYYEEEEEEEMELPRKRQCLGLCPIHCTKNN
ncbi:7582_t:CDS:1, partial [Entrophospora sp. SA101]